MANLGPTLQNRSSRLYPGDPAFADYKIIIPKQSPQMVHEDPDPTMLHAAAHQPAMHPSQLRQGIVA